jgi:hypothetical protein
MCIMALLIRDKIGSLSEYISPHNALRVSIFAAAKVSEFFMVLLLLQARLRQDQLRSVLHLLEINHDLQVELLGWNNDGNIIQ